MRLLHAFIGLGANLGDRAKAIRAAAAALSELGEVLGVSQLYETPPAGPPEQPDYLNAAAHLVTPRSEEALLHGLLQLERRFGRIREPQLRNGPRTLDLDLLMCGPDGETILDLPDLVLPHPRLHLRTFALRPLLDLAPSLVHPLLSLPLSSIYDGLLRSEPPPRPYLRDHTTP